MKLFVEFRKKEQWKYLNKSSEAFFTNIDPVFNVYFIDDTHKYEIAFTDFAIYTVIYYYVQGVN